MYSLTLIFDDNSSKTLEASNKKEAITFHHRYVPNNNFNNNLKQISVNKVSTDELINRVIYDKYKKKWVDICVNQN